MRDTTSQKYQYHYSMNPNIILLDKYTSPFGHLIIGMIDRRLCLCDWAGSEKFRHNLEKVKQLSSSVAFDGISLPIARVEEALDAYFEGRLRKFDIPLAVYGTPFQKRVWQALDKIPYGRTTTYAALANELGIPKSVRAVAAAVARNPLSIVRPCHRAIGSGGQLTGYAGGLDAKRGLLRLEGIL